MSLQKETLSKALTYKQKTFTCQKNMSVSTHFHKFENQIKIIYNYMTIKDLKIDLSTFHTPVVTEKQGMFVADDHIYTNYTGFLQTEEGVLFTGTVFYPEGRRLEE